MKNPAKRPRHERARTIQEHQQLQLSVRDSEVFIEAFLHPKPVTDRLRETILRYRQGSEEAA